MARVLVVDDDLAIRRTVAEVLAGEGYEVRAAADGRDALDVIRAWQPDLVLLDFTMPIMDGEWLLREMRLRDDLSRTRVVGLSGRPDGDAVVAELGLNGWIGKPFDIDELLKQVRVGLGEGDSSA